MSFHLSYGWRIISFHPPCVCELMSFLLYFFEEVMTFHLSFVWRIMSFQGSAQTSLIDVHLGMMDYDL